MKCDKGTGIFAQAVKMNIHESGGGGGGVIKKIIWLTEMYHLL